MIGWLVLIVGAALPFSLYGEEPVVTSYSEEVLDSGDELDFDTTFVTTISPLFSLDSSFSSPPKPQEQISDYIKFPELQLPPSPEIDLSRIRDLRKAGVLSLAESLLVAGLPAREGQMDWYSWNKELWEVLDESHQYQRLITFLGHLALQTNGDQRLEVLERLAQAHQKNADFVAGRTIVRDLLLTITDDPIRLARLRRLLIHNYVDSGLLADAEAASIRYQKEYLPDDTEWNILRGQILLENGEPSKAVAQLVGLQDQKARLMLVLARLNEGSMEPDSVISFLERREFSSARLERLELFRVAIIAEAARVGGVPRTRAKMLEILLAAGIENVPMLPDIYPTLLLEAYIDVATAEGNKSHLLFGQYDEWVKFADELPIEKKDIARAIYALLLQNQVDHEIAAVAHKGLIELLLDESRYSVVVSLYGYDAPFGRIPEVDEALLVRLSKLALDYGDYSIAVEIAKQLKQIPAGITQWSWQLQIARLEIFSGKTRDGANRLLSVLNDSEALEPNQLDQLLQVAFDLQTISRHDLALDVFRAAGPFTQTLRQRRELLFWMGESKIGQKKYAQGADLFLQSAEVGHQAGDLWGQSARFRAAEALGDAGLFKDAFNIYESLLNESQDKNRQLQLAQKLQELNLRKAIREQAGL